MSKSDRKFHFLVTGEITFIPKGETASQFQKVNLVYTNEHEYLNVKALANIQTKLQMNFHTIFSRNNPAPPDITNVTILGISRLGHFTKEEFHAGAPEETKA